MAKVMSKTMDVLKNFMEVRNLNLLGPEMASPKLAHYAHLSSRSRKP